MTDHSPFRQTGSTPAPRHSQTTAVGGDLAYFDLDAQGRILFRNAMAVQFLTTNPDYLRGSGGVFLSIEPIRFFADALQAACNSVRPTSTVFTPEEPSGNAAPQINVLPYRPTVARVVVFWSGGGPEDDIALPVPKLTARERTVLELSAAGLRRDRIAYELNISMPTVDMHCRNLRRKLSAQTTPEAVALAMKMDLLRS